MDELFKFLKIFLKKLTRCMFQLVIKANKFIAIATNHIHINHYSIVWTGTNPVHLQISGRYFPHQSPESIQKDIKLRHARDASGVPHQQAKLDDQLPNKK